MNSGIAERIRRLQSEIDALEREQRQELVTAIVIVVGPGVPFTAKELLQHAVIHPDLAAVLIDAGIRSPKQLGRRLEKLSDCGVQRNKEERSGVLWTVEL